jgi:hypothetical protein
VPWIRPELDTDPDAIAVRVLNAIADRIEGWEAFAGDPLVVIGEEISRELANQRELMLNSIDLAVAGIGESVHGVAPFLDQPAQLRVELTLASADTLTPDFVVVGTGDAGDEVAFQLTDAVTLPVGPSEVTMTAVVPGEAGNTVPVGPLTIATSTISVVSAVAVLPASGGRDAETLEEYLDRLTAVLATLRFGAVIADDLAALARNVDGVERAFGVDLYDPSNPTVQTQRAATVFPVGEDGLPVSAGVKANLLNYLEGLREANFLHFLADPRYTAITVTYDVIADPGTIATVVKGEVDATVGRWLSPATWGSTTDDPQAWVPTPKVRFLELARVIGSVPGVSYVQGLTLNGGTGDVTLTTATQPVGLPAPNATITGTVA